MLTMHVCMCFQRQESAQRVGGNVKQITAVFQTGKDVMAKMTAVTIPMRKKGVAHHVIILAISSAKINDVFQNVGYVTLTTIVMMVAMRRGLCVVGVAQFKNLIYQYSGVIFISVISVI